MAKANTGFALNMAKLSVKAVDTEKRAITSEKVQRPTRDILAAINADVRAKAWEATITSVANAHGERVDAKGAVWIVNNDEAARALRVNYNLIQPEYFTGDERKTVKLDKQGSRDLWTQVFQMKYGETVTDKEGNETPNMPVFLDESDEQDRD